MMQYSRFVENRLIILTLTIVTNLSVYVIGLSLSDGLLRVSSQYLKTHAIVAGYGAHSVYNVYWIMGQKCNWEVPWGSLDERVQLT